MDYTKLKLYFDTVVMQNYLERATKKEEKELGRMKEIWEE
jgi:hypothetical protein